MLICFKLDVDHVMKFINKILLSPIKSDHKWVAWKLVFVSFFVDFLFPFIRLEFGLLLI